MPKSNTQPSAWTQKNIQNTALINKALAQLGTPIQTEPIQFPKGESVYGSHIKWTSPWPTWRGFDEPQTHKNVFLDTEIKPKSITIVVTANCNMALNGIETQANSFRNLFTTRMEKRLSTIKLIWGKKSAGKFGRDGGIKIKIPITKKTQDPARLTAQLLLIAKEAVEGLPNRVALPNPDHSLIPLWTNQ
jgi:hypothetical protein